MYLQGCLPSNRCGAPRLDHRYPKPYVKSNLIDLAIDPFSLNELLPHVMMHFRCIKKNNSLEDITGSVMGKETAHAQRVYSKILFCSPENEILNFPRGLH